MHHSLLVASTLVVVCLVLPAVPAAAQSEAALIERNEAAAIADLKTIMTAERGSGDSATTPTASSASTRTGACPSFPPEGRCPWEEREGKPAGCEVLY